MTYNTDLVKMSEKTPIVIGQAVSEFLTHKVSSGRKLISVIEDLHWFDKHSLLLLEILPDHTVDPCNNIHNNKARKK